LSVDGCAHLVRQTAEALVAGRRKGLDEAIAYVRGGNTIVMWRLDRLGRSLKHLIEVVTDLEKRGIGFKSLTE
jgi:DNA invertase Pin-like site-specific DNA recombinase